MAAKQSGDDASLKSIYRPENQAFLAVLRGLRTRANLTQADLAQRLGRSQNFVTAAERGVTRLDGLQLRDWCAACNSDLVAWAKAVEKALK
ncbi:helix-turn-helix transcriptional regulator [Luteibacter sp. 9135]|uniref:helix-turn-helix domain-containing protein n=1 Tax=Lysobacterales TaxID=135614 RepID=UPI00055E8A9F|nr:helix-turn-helix transcriptional regulator [Luteibacter sp. 9135]